METISLNGLWNLGCDGAGGALPEDLSVPASVPGDVHLDLVAAGLLPDPLVGTNCRLHAELEQLDFIYRTAFECGDRFDHAELVFDGLDCLAQVSLNGQLLGRTANAFIPHRFDVTARLQEAKRHELEVRIDAGVKWAAAQDGSGYRNAFSPERIWLRKPQFVFGWDWAPRLVSCGIWRDVRLRLYRRACIRDYNLEHRASGRRARRLGLDVEIECFREGPYRLRVDLDSELTLTRKTRLHEGMNRLRLDLGIHKPALWYPSGYGKQALYPLALSLSAGGEPVDRVEGEYGFRTVELDQEPIEGGRRFRLLINGVPVFARGANWVPPDLIPARAGEEKKRRLLAEALGCHMNMLRVWGGGIYETREFYRRCDRLGILIWQDFMFACAEYPDDHQWFMNAVEKEARWVCRSLRAHACLSLLCGNNENHWIYGYRKRGEQRGNGPFKGRRCYDELLPDICAELLPAVPYWPSSPYGGDFPNSEEEGDTHSWSVSILSRAESERSDIHRYRLDKGKFVSEYGVLSSALPPSIRQATGQSGIDASSPAYRFHDNSFNDGKIDAYLRTAFGRVPQDTLRYIWESLAYQAAGLREAIANHRRRLAECGGSLFWMYSDCWGTQGWSIIDYYLRKKPSYYWVRRAFSPLAVFSIAENEKAEVWAVNNTVEPLALQLSVDIGSFDPKTRCREIHSLELSPNRALPAAVLYGVSGWISAVLHREGKPVAEDTVLTHHPRYLDIGEARLEVSRSDGPQGETRLEIESEDFVHMVCLQLPDDAEPDDNYFNLPPQRKASIGVRGLGGRPVGVSALNAPVEVKV